LVALWDAASGSLRQTLVGPHDPNRICIGDWIAWSSDGTRLLISHGAYTQLWDVHAGSILHERTDVYDDSYTLLPSPDTRMVAAQCETTISVWDARTDVLLWEGLCPDQAIHTFRWSSDSTRLLTATGEWGRESHIPVEHQYVRLWDATTGAHIQAFPGAAGWLSPSGALILTVANQRFVRIWDCTTGEIRQTILLEHERAAQEIIWSPDERTLLVNTYTALELWDVASGRLITALPCSTGYSVQWSPDSRMLAAINIPYSRFLVWTVAARQPSRTLPSSQQSIEALLWGTDGIQSIVRQSGMEVHRYGPDFQSIRAKLPTGLHPQHAMWFPDQRRILMSAYVHQSYDAKEQAQPIWRWFAWDTTTNTMHELSLGHGLPTRLDWHVTTQIRFSPDGQVYACVASGAVRVFDSADHTVLQNIPVIAQIHTSIQIAWSQESTHLLIVGQSPASEARQIQIRVQMWDRAQDRLVQDTTVSRKQHVRILGLGWSPIGPQMLISVAHTGSHLQTCELWDLTHGQVHTTLDIPVPQLRHASWSPEGQQIVVFSERAAWIFNSTRGELTAVVESTAPLGAPFAWSPDGLQLLISGAWRGAVPLACHVIDPALLIAELTRRVGEFSRSTSRSYHPEYQPHEEELRSNIPDWQGERSEVAIAGNLLTQYDRMVAQLPVA
jgi:WD40 repeat protein